ncbi:MAG: hypothetical protein NTV86_10430 [Planctomycetota bacterium]|nr:hypothetical protein [Planctomycetota bacterium]
MMFKDAGREAIRGKRKFPPDHPVFSANPCHIYKDTVESIRTCVNYIRGNFTNHKLPLITYPFVVPYNGWPFHKKLHPSR